MTKLFNWLTGYDAGPTLKVRDRVICDLIYCDWKRFWRIE